MNSLNGLGVRVLTINSPSDLQVWTQFYQPLHAFVLGLKGSQISIIPGLTHAMTPASFANNKIVQEVLQTIISFLQS